jgi:O-antigen ligase
MTTRTSSGPRQREATGPLERTATALLVAGALFAPLNDVRPVAGLSIMTMADALLVAGFGLLTPVLLNRKLIMPGSFVLGWALLLPAALVASVLASDVATSFNHLARLLAAALVLPAALLWWRPDRRVISRLAAAYLVGAAVSVIAAVVEGPIDDENRYDGLTTHPNFLGHTAVIAIALTPFVTSQISALSRWFCYALALLCGYGVWISGSRAALVGLAVLAVLYPLLERSLLAAGGLVLGLAMTLLFWDQILGARGGNALGRLLGTTTSETSNEQRRGTLSAELERFLAEPLTGHGFENALAAHNIYLQIAVSAGIIGLLGFLLVLWTLISPLFTARRSALWRLGYVGIAYLVIGVLDKSLWDRFIWVGLALALLALVAERDSSAPRLSAALSSGSRSGGGRQ